MQSANSHTVTKQSLRYFSSGLIWEGRCAECGYFTGKCISEAEVDHRLSQHRAAKTKQQ